MQIRQFSFEISWPLVDQAFRYVWYQTMSIMLDLALIFGGFSLSANPHSLTDVANIFVNANSTQLPGRLFSPSNISKKLSHHFLLHFWNGIGSYNHHGKYQGVFPVFIFFIRVPLLDKENFKWNQRGGPLWKKCFIEAPETLPNILRGGHRNPYQFKNAIKSGGTVFCLGISLGLNSLPGSCEWLTINQDLVNKLC